MTGSNLSDEKCGITRFRIIGKHGRSRIAFDAKANVNREIAQSIVLGLRHADRVESGAAFALARSKLPSARFSHDVVLQLLDDETLLGDDVLDQVAD